MRGNTNTKADTQHELTSIESSADADRAIASDFNATWPKEMVSNESERMRGTATLSYPRASLLASWIITGR